MSDWITRTGRPALASLDERTELSPSLLFHKWHAFDVEEQRRGKIVHTFETNESRLRLLEGVVTRVETARRRGYATWWQSYARALEALGAPGAPSWPRAATIWRLAVGFATNPALETGLALHSLHGFPYLPGSAVRGLVRHVAEMRLLAPHADWPAAAEPPAPEALETFLADAERVGRLFGSLAVEPIDAATWRRYGGERPRLETPRSLLMRWLATPGLRLPERRRQAERVRALLALQTGGRVAFYDAVPDPAEADLVQIDVLNPHYPSYTEQHGGVPPSDDQNPRPIFFLAVRPGAQFAFPFRVAPAPASAPAGAAGEEQTGAAVRLLTECLREGLTLWGAGAKTASGYGTFDFPERREAGRAAPEAPAAAPAWEDRARAIGWGEAAAHVPKILAELSGAERARAAAIVIEKLGRRKLAQKRDRPWVEQLLAAAAQG